MDCFSLHKYMYMPVGTKVVVKIMVCIVETRYDLTSSLKERESLVTKHLLGTIYLEKNKSLLYSLIHLCSYHIINSQSLHQLTRLEKELPCP